MRAKDCRIIALGNMALLVLLLACSETDFPITQTVRLDTIAMVSFRGLPSPTAASPVAINSDMDRIAVALRDDGEILVFNGEGSLVRRFGRIGAGPGEYREISAVTFQPRSDTLWILDEGNARISVLGLHDDELAREIPLHGRIFGAAWASDTLLVVQGRFVDDSPENALGRAVRLQGGIEPTLSEGVIRLDRFDAFIRPITSSTSGGIWAGDFRNPDLRRFDSTLTETGTFQYTAPFPDTPPENAELWADYLDVEPAVLGLTEDSTGNLWILFGIPADPLPRITRPGRALAEHRVNPADLASTVLVKYEPEALSRGPLSEFEAKGPTRGGLLPGGYAYYIDTDDLGEATLTIVRLTSPSYKGG